MDAAMDAARAADGSFGTRPFESNESRWQAHLNKLPTWQPTSDILTIVAPHPDDETLGAGGLIYTCAERGHEIRVILVTDGERGHAESPDLIGTRAMELRNAMSRLAPDGARISYLHLPDGEVAERERHLTERLIDLVSPRSTLVAPYERDGHPDYDATSRACRAAAKALGIRCVRYPIWAWDRLEPEELTTEAMARVPLSDEAREAKQRAIQCYVSQTEPGPGGAVVPPHVLEHFQRPYEVFVV
jgi:LmbE family N-acetylglucosaminyl deacetylase